MEEFSIEINGKTYPLHWDNRTTFLFGRHRGKATVSDCFKEFGFLAKYLGDTKSTEEISIDDLETIMDMAFFAIQSGCKKQGMKMDLTLDDLYNEIDNVSLTASVILLVYASLPVVREEDKKKVKL